MNQREIAVYITKLVVGFLIVPLLKDYISPSSLLTSVACSQSHSCSNSRYWRNGLFELISSSVVPGSTAGSPHRTRSTQEQWKHVMVFVMSNEGMESFITARRTLAVQWSVRTAESCKRSPSFPEGSAESKMSLNLARVALAPGPLLLPLVTHALLRRPARTPHRLILDFASRWRRRKSGWLSQRPSCFSLEGR